MTLLVDGGVGGHNGRVGGHIGRANGHIGGARALLIIHPGQGT